MTKEQKTAIERIENKLKEPRRNAPYMIEPRIYNDIDIEIVLSMLKHNSAEIEKKNTELAEKNAEIEKLKKVLDEKYIFVAGARTVYDRLMGLDKEDIVKNDLALRNEIYQHIEDNEKKDKIIDLMAEEINETDRGYTDYCEMKIECDRNCKDCIKRYHERKATNNG